jgi:probable selenium-dependent hydroxylase accessory protein YqeC
MSISTCKKSAEKLDGEGKDLSLYLKVEHGDVVCFVGGGGKTSLMYSVGHQMREMRTKDSFLRVLVCTTTTRFVRPQVPDEVDFCLSADTPEELLEDFLHFLHSLPSIPHLHGAKKAEESGHDGVILVGVCISASRTADGVEHVRGVNLTWTQRLFSRLSPPHPSQPSHPSPSVAVLIEADGARMLPFKVPMVAKGEPCYPMDTSLIVAVVGVDAYHSLLDEAHVCRSREVAQSTGCELGGTVDAECIGKAMGNPEHWNIPPLLKPRGGYYVCINKVDCAEGEQMERAREIALKVHSIGLEYALYKGVFITGQNKMEKRGCVFDVHKT